MGHISMNKFGLFFTISLCVFPKVTTSSVDLEDPFLLLFGPKHGDAFASREGCSLAMELEKTFRIGNTAVSKAYVCLDGVIKFTLPIELFAQNGPHSYLNDFFHHRDFQEFDYINEPIVAPFLAPHKLENRFLDYRCLYSVEENSFYGNQFWCRELYDEYFNPVGTVYQYDDYDLNFYWNSYENMNAEKQLEWIKELHSRKLTENNLKDLIHKDDKLALNYFGQNSTKYVNLADNIFTRQLQSDEHPEELEILTKVVRIKEGNEGFTADWALVVTWYKIIFYCYSSDNFNGYNYECTASFQLLIVCDEKSNDVITSSVQNKCFVIFNYFEITGSSHYQPRRAEQICGFFTSLRQTLVQCLRAGFSIDTLVQKSNIGVEGVWLYEISNQSDVIFPEDYNVISTHNNFTVHDLNSFEDDEPFLLKFGPISGDTYISRGKTCSMPEVLQRGISLGPVSTDFVLICEAGFLSMTGEERSHWSIWDDDYSSNSAFIVPHVLHEHWGNPYRQSEFFDYSCLYSTELFSPASYYDDVCSKIVIRENPSSSLALLPTYGIENVELREAVLEWNRKSLQTNFSEVDIKYDDEISRLVLGENSTKYVNLAGNVFKRETENETDLAIINSFINRVFPSFEAIFAYVVTWYKIGTTKHADRFNSFQCIIASGENETFIIEDFNELQWGDGTSKHHIEIQGSTANVQSPPKNLTSGSNFLAPDKWVYQLFRQSKEIITNFSFSSIHENQNAFDEPFLLPFGPKHGDTFSFQLSNNDWPIYASYGRGCSFPQILNNRIQVYETTFDWLFVCLNGRIELRSFEETANWQENGYGTRSLEVAASFKISVFETDLDSTTAEDHLMDYLCVFSETGKEADLNFQYLADPCPREKRPWEKWDWHNFINMDVWPTSKDDLTSVIDWNIERNIGRIDFRSDDEVAQRIFGINNTKYINLVNNMFWRESYGPADLLKIQKFVRTNPNMSNFEVTRSYVITWYKISAGESIQYSNTILFSNSFQLALACGADHGNVSKQICFVIFDYFELEHPPSVENPGIYMSINPDYVIPVEWKNLTSSSNYGFPGRWVFDVTNGTKPLGSDDFNITHSDIIRDGSGEPFLLPFGPKHGDEFGGKSKYNGCQQIYLHQFLTDSTNYDAYFRNCRFGFAVFRATCSPAGCFASWKYPIFAIYPLLHVNTHDNIMDYVCTESYFDYKDDLWTMYREFCSIVDSSRVFSWEFFNPPKQLYYGYPLYDHFDWELYQDYYKAMRFAYNDDENEAIQNWNELVWKDEPEQLDIHSDDELARVLMGEKSTKYVNLANNVYKRQTRNQSDLSTINSLLQTRYPDFESSWALVVTWYKLPPQFSSSNTYNSYQAILTCDGRTNSTTDKNSSCFVIFDYFEIQWTEAARYFFDWSKASCGVKENRLNFLELSLSGTENLRNLWAESNFGVPGIWVIELSQSEGTFANAKRACSPLISPILISMFNRTVAFTVEDFFCYNGKLNETDTITFQFEGIRVKSIEVPGKSTGDGKMIEAVLEKHWGQVDNVQVTIKVNGVIQSPVFAITFYHYNDLIEQPKTLKMRRNGNEFEVDIPHDAQITSASSEFQLIFNTKDGEFVDVYYVSVAVDASFTLVSNRSLDSFWTVVGSLKTPSADGETIDPKSDLAILHSKFGETWAVRRGDWLFTHEPFLMEINKEIELLGRTYEAVYDFTFANETLHQTAEQLCRNISECLVDIALSGKTSMAEAFTITQSQVEKFALFNEIQDVNGPEPPMETTNLIINTPQNLRPLQAKNIQIKNIKNIRFRQFN